MRNSLSSTLLTILGLLSTPGTADACGTCAMAMLDYHVPSVVAWCLFSVVWLLALSLANEFGCERAVGIPGLKTTLAMIFVAFTGGAMILGPLLFIGLLVWALYGAASVVFNNIQLTPAKTRSLKIISISGIVVLAGLSVNSAYTRHTRTDVDFILAWPSSSPANVLFTELRGRAANSLPQLRELVNKDDTGRFRGQAAESLGNFGDPEKDVPLLISALAESGSTSADAPRIQAALRCLTCFFDLPDTTSYKTWEERWSHERPHRVVK